MYLFSDNCPSQNKNRYIYQMMSLLTLKMQTLNEIQLIFSKKRTHSECERQYAFYNWTCKKRNKYLSSLPMGRRKVNLPASANHIMYKWWTKNLITDKLKDIKGNPHKVKWSSLRHVCLQRPCGNKIKMLYKYDLTTLFQAAVIGNLKKQLSSSYEQI